MQTFLPYEDFKQSLDCLDYRRLGKQRVECLQMLRTYIPGDTKKGWSNHPVTKMWSATPKALAYYGLLDCDCWISRGYKDTTKQKILDAIMDIVGPVTQEELSDEYANAIFNGDSDFLPIWFGNKAYHDSHKSNLLRKNHEFYSQYGWDVPDDLPYVYF